MQVRSSKMRVFSFDRCIFRMTFDPTGFASLHMEIYTALLLFLPRHMHFSENCKARSCDRMSSVCPSVTLVNCDDIGWKSRKLIALY